MFCPRCGSMQSDELKFCKSCGANLHAVRRVVDTQQTHKKHDRNKPWFAEMAMHEAESKRRQAELDHRRGIGALIKRALREQETGRGRETGRSAGLRRYRNQPARTPVRGNYWFRSGRLQHHRRYDQTSQESLTNRILQSDSVRMRPFSAKLIVSNWST